MVTGASSGLGREYCLDLAEAGCRIVAVARRVDRLKSLCDEINGGDSLESSGKPSREHIRAVAVELDISVSGAAIEAAENKAWDAFGTIDALINNAGMRGRVHSPLDLSEKEWNETIRTNGLSKYVCKKMRGGGGGGSIINVSSITGLERGQLPGALAYVASKTALNSITKVMALEFGDYNIRVNSISPGLFKSEPKL